MVLEQVASFGNQSNLKCGTSILHSLTEKEPHNPVVTNVRLHRQPKWRKHKRSGVVKRRDLSLLKEENGERFNRALDAQLRAWLEKYKSTSDTEALVSHLKAYLSAVDLIAPEVDHPVAGYKSRCEKSLGIAREQLSAAKKWFKNSGSRAGSREHNSYKIAKKKYEDLDAKFKCEDESFYWRLLGSYRSSGDFRSFHRAIRERKAGKSTSTTVECLVDRNGVARYKTAEMLEIMAQNLTELYDGDDTIEVEPDEACMRENHVYNSLCDADLTEEEITAAVGWLNNKKPPGIDGVCIEMVSDPTETQVRAFHELFNKHFGGEYPWKDDRKIPLYTKGGRTNSDNYRFIGVQVTFRNIFNKILERRLNSFIELDPWQCAFQSGKRGSDNYFAIKVRSVDHCDARRPTHTHTPIQLTQRANRSNTVNTFNRANWSNRANLSNRANRANRPNQAN